MKNQSDMKVKILLTNATCMHNLDCEYNKGSAAVAISAIKVLKSYIPNSEFASLAQYSDSFAKQHGLRVINNSVSSRSMRIFSLSNSIRSTLDLTMCIIWHIIFTKLHVDAKRLINSKILKEFYETDLIVDLSMDLFSDNLGTISIIEHSKSLLCGIMLGKPVVVFAQSLGPFRSKLNALIAKFTLNKVDLITVREELANQYLKDIGVNKPPIHLTADPAFLLETASKDRISKIFDKNKIDKSIRPLIGITISHVIVAKGLEKSKPTKLLKYIYKLLLFFLPDLLLTFIDNTIKKTNYFSKLNNSLSGVDDIINVIDYLTNKLNATILLIPHSIAPSESLSPIGDDRSTAERLYKMVKCRERVILISDEYTSEELKGIIGECDILISSKMHANIAALSQCIPVVGLAYSHKFYAIMKMLGQEKYVCNNINYYEIVDKIDDVWRNIETIRSELNIKIPAIKENSMKNGKFVKDLLISRYPATGKSFYRECIESDCAEF